MPDLLTSDVLTGTNTKTVTNKTILSSVISPASITADQTDYNPTGLATTETIELNPNNSFPSIGGLAGGVSGRNITLVNVSVNSILLSDELTTLGQASTAANRFALGGYDHVLFGKKSVQLRYNSTLGRWITINPQTPIIPPVRMGWYNAQNLAVGGEEPYISGAASGGETNTFDGSGIAAHPGVLRWTLGTSTTGSGSHFVTSTRNMLLGNSWYWRIEEVLKILQLSNGTDNYTLRVGFIGSSSAEGGHTVQFRYNHAVNSGNWQLVARSENTETATNSSSAVGTNWTRLTIIINPAATVAQFFVNGVSVGTVTSNIPTQGGRAVSQGLMFLKSAGTANTAFLDLGSIETIGYANVSN